MAGEMGDLGPFKPFPQDLSHGHRATQLLTNLTGQSLYQIPMSIGSPVSSIEYHLLLFPVLCEFTRREFFFSKLRLDFHPRGLTLHDEAKLASVGEKGSANSAVDQSGEENQPSSLVLVTSSGVLISPLPKRESPHL